MTPITIGRTSTTSQGIRYSYNPRTGFANGQVFHGTLDAMLAQAASLVALRYGFDFEQDGAFARITINAVPVMVDGTTGTEIPVDTWSMSGNEVQKSWDQHPKAIQLDTKQFGNLAVINGLAQQYRSQQPFSGSPYNLDSLPPGFPATWDFTTGGGSKDDAQAFFDALCTDQDHYGASQMVLRHTQSISDAYAYDAAHWAFGDVETIFTPTQLLAECGVGVGARTWGYVIPATMAAVITMYDDAPTLMNTDRYRWGWRKLPVTMSTAAQNRLEVVTEYVLDGWLKIYYDAKA